MTSFMTSFISAYEKTAEVDFPWRGRESFRRVYMLQFDAHSTISIHFEPKFVGKLLRFLHATQLADLLSGEGELAVTGIFTTSMQLRERCIGNIWTVRNQERINIAHFCRNTVAFWSRTSTRRGQWIGLACRFWQGSSSFRRAVDCVHMNRDIFIQANLVGAANSLANSPCTALPTPLALSTSAFCEMPTGCTTSGILSCTVNYASRRKESRVTVYLLYVAS